MKLKDIFIFLTIILLAGCSSDEPEAPGEQPSASESETEETIYSRQNRWIYEMMNHHYLWREDLPDSLSLDFFQAPNVFFENLLSPKDRFSYMLSNSSRSGGTCGIAYQTYKDRRGKTASQILYVNNEDARRQGVKRGDFFEIQNHGTMIGLRSMSLSSDGCFETTPGSEIQLSCIQKAPSSNSVYLDSIYEIDNRRIGYMCYLEYEDSRDVETAMKRFYEQGIDELILDLRYNPGGYVSTSCYLSSCIVPAEGYEKIYQQQVFNSIIAKENFDDTGYERDYVYFKKPYTGTGNTISAQVQPLQLPRLYVLVSKGTASASEATIIALRPFMEVILIGETTVGKGVGSYNLSDSEFPYSIQPITFRYYNSQEETVPDEGLTVDYEIPGGYSTTKREIGEVEEPMLNFALGLICPGFSGTQPQELPMQPTFGLEAVGEPSYVEEFKQKQHIE